jgi:hypothetical protein
MPLAPTETTTAPIVQLSGPFDFRRVAVLEPMSMPSPALDEARAACVHVPMANRQEWVHIHASIN